MLNDFVSDDLLNPDYSDGTDEPKPDLYPSNCHADPACGDGESIDPQSPIDSHSCKNGR